MNNKFGVVHPLASEQWRRAAFWNLAQTHALHDAAPDAAINFPYNVINDSRVITCFDCMGVRMFALHHIRDKLFLSRTIITALSRLE